MNILALGDVVSDAAVEYLSGRLWTFRQRNSIDTVIINGENASMRGILPAQADMLFEIGADVITGGNHSFDKRDAFGYMDNTESILRPANFPADFPGHGYTVYKTQSGYRLLVMCISGIAMMEEHESPFATADRILERESGNFDISALDIHAEATAEKQALARYLDGRVTMIFGTHTHVLTADARVFPGGTGYITDLGMCGPDGGVIGIKSEQAIERFLTGKSNKNIPAEGEIHATGACFEVDPCSGRCLSARTVSF